MATRRESIAWSRSRRMKPFEFWKEIECHSLCRGKGIGVWRAKETLYIWQKTARYPHWPVKLKDKSALHIVMELSLRYVKLPYATAGVPTSYSILLPTETDIPAVPAYIETLVSLSMRSPCSQRGRLCRYQFVEYTEKVAMSAEKGFRSGTHTWVALASNGTSRSTRSPQSI